MITRRSRDNLAYFSMTATGLIMRGPAYKQEIGVRMHCRMYGCLFLQHKGFCILRMKMFECILYEREDIHRGITKIVV